MRTFEIPREAWVDQLNAFTTMHEGWLVSLVLADVLTTALLKLQLDARVAAP